MIHPTEWSTVLALVLGTVLLVRPSQCRAEEMDEAAVFVRSLVTTGDIARVQHALAKARRGEQVLVSVIGGSITQGAAASKPENRYGESIAAWWRQTFPNTKVEFVNAGIGATGSNYGALRAQRDLLSHKPDFVVAEYGVNDGNTQACAETLEGLTRQILTQPNQPALVLLFTMNNAGGNAQEWHGKVGTHYALPMVSFRDALWPEIEAKRLKWEDVEGDVVHPNDRGHAYCAHFVTSLLEKVLKELPADDQLLPIKPVPQPLFSDLYEHVALFEADALKPVTNEGWTCDLENPWAKGWKSDKPGSVIEFELEGQVIAFMEFHVRGPMGTAKVQVDDLPPATIDAWFDQTWGGWRCTHEIARDLKPGKHRVRVEILEEKNPESEGPEFRVLGLGAAGVTGG